MLPAIRAATTPGHTVKNERGKFVLNLIPSGILRPDVVCVMGGGMVIDPEHLEKEIAALTEKGVEISPKNLKISDRATIYYALPCGTGWPGGGPPVRDRRPVRLY